MEQWTALYNAALLLCAPDAAHSPPPQYFSRQDSGPRLGTFTPRTALSGKKGKHWMETNDFVSYCYISELSQTWSLVGNIWKTFCTPAPIRPAAPHGRSLEPTLMTF